MKFARKNAAKKYSFFVQESCYIKMDVLCDFLGFLLFCLNKQLYSIPNLFEFNFYDY